MRNLSALVFLVAPLALMISACGGGAADDPRCVSLCTIKEPSDPTVGDVCSQESADTCRETCGARIQDTGTVCADCLLEDADFGVKSSGGTDSCVDSPMCSNTQLCTEVGPGGSCDYCYGDKAAADACYKQIHPHREVACDVRFRDAAECASLCAN
ncbi:MAG: hypothetical protein U0441_25165 [Polyangiaceae bacterium]